jgi:hypothetical protein
MSFQKDRPYGLLGAIFLIAAVMPGFILAQKRYQTDTDIKRVVLKGHPVLPNWRKMEVIRIFPDQEDIKASRYFSNPADACRSGDFLYVVEYGLGRVFRFDKSGSFCGSFGRRGQGPGEFSRAGQIASSGSGDIFVTDSGRIQCFSDDGKFRGTFKVFSLVNDMIAGKSELFINPIYGPGGGEAEPLIIRYDHEGSPLEPFGERIDKKGHYSADSRAFIDFYGEKVIVAFRHYPLLRLYDEKSILIREARIDIPVLDRIAGYNNQKAFTNPAPGVVNLTRVLAGIQVVQGRIFVLLHMPRIEIHEIDLFGRVISSFYSDHLGEIVDYSGFVIWPIGNGLVAYIVTSTANDVNLSVLRMK